MAAWDADAAQAAVDYGTFDTRTESNLATLLPIAQRYARKWLRDSVLPWAAKNGLTVKIISGTRTYAE